MECAPFCWCCCPLRRALSDGFGDIGSRGVEGLVVPVPGLEGSYGGGGGRLGFAADMPSGVQGAIGPRAGEYKGSWFCA